MQILKPFLKLFLNTYTNLGYFIRTTYQFNSQIMDRPDKGKAATQQANNVPRTSSYGPILVGTSRTIIGPK